MEIQFVLNGKQVTTEAGPDSILLDILRDLGCKSVKCGRETTNCGLCKMRMRDNELRAVYRLDRWKVPSVLFCAGGRYHGTRDHHTGRC